MWKYWALVPYGTRFVCIQASAVGQRMYKSRVTYADHVSDIACSLITHPETIRLAVGVALRYCLECTRDDADESFA